MENVSLNLHLTDCATVATHSWLYLCEYLRALST